MMKLSNRSVGGRVRAGATLVLGASFLALGPVLVTTRGAGATAASERFARGADCAAQLEGLVAADLDASSLRDAIGASLRLRVDQARLPADADAVASCAAAFLAERCFGTGLGYCQWRLAGGALPSTPAIDEMADGSLDSARAALVRGDAARNTADAVLETAATGRTLVECATGTVAEPGILGVGASNAFGTDFWHTSSVASGVRVLCAAEELGGARLAPSDPTVSIGVALRFADGSRAPVQIAIGRAPGTGAPIVIGFWRFAPCGETVPDDLNLAF